MSGCGHLLCIRLPEGGPDDPELPVDNPRPGWEWPGETAKASRVSKDMLGLTREARITVSLEYDRLRWRSSDGSSDRSSRGAVYVGPAHVHGDVRTLHGEKTPVLEVVAPVVRALGPTPAETSSSSYSHEGSGKDEAVVIKFATLDEMQQFWVALSQTQQLLRKLDVERGLVDEEADEDALEEDSPRKAGRNERHADLSRGHFEPSVFLAVRRAYEKVLGLVIRPPRAKYVVEKLGPRRFEFGSKTIVRDDFTVVNTRGLRIKCSLWRPGAAKDGYAYAGDVGATAEDFLAAAFPTVYYSKATANAGNAEPLPPVVVYLHGNASCRLEAITALSLCLGLGLAVCALDCAGSGLSDGDFVSLGYYEADDVLAVVDYLKTAYAAPSYALWGRSMGAVTSLLYVAEKAPDCACVVADSPFASIKRLCYDLVHKVSTHVPDGAVLLAVRKIRRSVKYRAGFDMYRCNPDVRVVSSKTPALIVHGANDDFILPKHTDRIARAYGGACDVVKPAGNHNAKRPVAVFLKIADLFKTHLLREPNMPSLLDFDGFSHPAVPNPFLLPPWFFHPKTRDKATGRVTSVEPNPAYFQPHHHSGKMKTYPHGHDPAAAADPHPDEGADEFVSGMSEQRQQETEATVGKLFGGGGKK